MIRAALIVLTLGTAVAAAGAPPAPAAVTASVLTAETAAVPSGTVTVGWRFFLADGWHLYTNGRNDTGYPPDVALELPPGWEASPLRWPVGRRLASPGDILDHVYEDELILLQTLRVPRDAQPGREAVLHARPSWLACREGCVPGDTTLTFTLPVAVGTGRTAHAEQLDDLRAALPRDARPDEYTAAWRGHTLLLSVPGAAHLEFHPAADAGPLQDLTADGAADAATLTLRFRPRDGRVGPARGTVLAVNGDTVRHLTLDIPAAPAAAQPQGDKP